MLEYTGKPFAEGLSAYVFSPEREPDMDHLGMLLGIGSRILEHQVGKNSAVAQYNKDIYCVPFDLAMLPGQIPVESRIGSFGWRRQPSQTQLQPSNEEDLEIIRRLVAGAIAKKQIENGWFVEHHGFAYHWSFNLSKQLYTELMDVYPGFVFRPSVYKDGSCALMIDPRFKFVSKKNLRDEINDLFQKGLNKEQVKLSFEGDFVIDTCPVVECVHRKNPSSNCRLSGAGKRKRLVLLDFSRRPSEASIGNLIDYHKAPSICQSHGRIAEKIRDLPPIVLVERAGRKGLLEYPAERLRQQLRLEKLDRPQRLLVMKYIQPPMNVRWKLTENFATYVDDIQMGRKHTLKLIRQFAKAGSRGKSWENYSIFGETPLAFRNKTSSYDPFLGLERNGPYDLDGENRRNFSSMQIVICNLSSRLTPKDIKRFYYDLVEGFSRGVKFAGMKKIFRLDIPKFSEDLVFPNLRSIEYSTLREQPDVVIVLAPQFERHKVMQYGPFKHELTKRGISSQFILDDKFSPRITLGRYVSYLKNIVLALYYKAGGIPWVLSRSINPNSCFLGLATLTRRDTTCMSTQIFDSFGMWLGGWTEHLEKDEYPNRLVQRISEARRIYSKEKRRSARKVILHKYGEMWPEIELEPIVDAFPSDLKCVSIKRPPLPRMYDPETRTDYMVQRGSFVQINTNVALLATSGPPNPIRGSQRPILIDLKNPSDNSELESRCEEIFNLSLLFGYSLAVISKPITTRFAEKAVGLASKYKIRESAMMWKKAWFL